MQKLRLYLLQLINNNAVYDFATKKGGKTICNIYIAVRSSLEITVKREEKALYCRWQGVRRLNRYTSNR